MDHFSPIDSAEHFLELLGFLGPKTILALLCGGIIGLERELKHKAAGIKTNMLICSGAALYTGLSLLMATHFTQKGYMGDPARIAAQIVSGIGFLGGGAIIQSRGTVVGLTTAATIWVVAAIGICVGLGYYGTALFCTVLVVGVLVAIRVPVERLLGKNRSFTCEVTFNDPGGNVRMIIMRSLEEYDLEMEDIEIKNRGTRCILMLTYHGNISDHKKFLMSLWAVEGVEEVDQIR